MSNDIIQNKILIYNISINNKRIGATHTNDTKNIGLVKAADVSTLASTLGISVVTLIPEETTSEGVPEGTSLLVTDGKLLVTNDGALLTVSLGTLD